MRMVGDTIEIQRGEKFSLDFELIDYKGEPLTILNKWKNPYIIITVTSARNKQVGDYRKTWWLDLNNRYVEDIDGNLRLEIIKKFTSNEILKVENFSCRSVLQEYGVGAKGRLVVDDRSDFDIKNFLYMSYVNNEKVFKYIESYKVIGAAELKPEIWTQEKEYNFGDIVIFNDKLYLCKYNNILNNIAPEHNHDTWILLNITSTNFIWKITNDWTEDTPNIDGECCLINGIPSVYISTFPELWYPIAPELYVFNINNFVDEVWKDYDFRVITSFETDDWVEQTYLYDMKIVSSDVKFDEYLYNMIISQEEYSDELQNLPWSIDIQEKYLNYIKDCERKKYLYDMLGMPISPNYNINAVILETSKINVSSNIQKGGRYE